ncbi:hypothetical protein BC943DRAFT_336049 [Umbelopsis sp. AD052]|nr:hypothetical protein BC943DRAFT_336049 [Umbelopsis sp. AD052]
MKVSSNTCPSKRVGFLSCSLETTSYSLLALNPTLYLSLLLQGFDFKVYRGILICIRFLKLLNLLVEHTQRDRLYVILQVNIETFNVTHDKLKLLHCNGPFDPVMGSFDFLLLFGE